jgi:regulatory protein
MHLYIILEQSFPLCIATSFFTVCRNLKRFPRKERESFLNKQAIAFMSTNEPQEALFDETDPQRQLRAALVKAYRLLAVRARSEKELREALARAKFAEEIIAATIEDCKQQRFIDDANFARQFIQSRLRNRPMGRERLTMELRQKGIDAETIITALDEVLMEQEALSLANHLADKQRKRLMNLPPAKARQRLADFLRRRGFDWETIQGTRFWKKLQENASDDE